MAQQVFINEIHYDNDGTDSGEAVEIAAPSGTDLTGWSLVLYNGSNNETYQTIPLTGAVPASSISYGFLSVNTPGIQNGSPDAIALVNAAGEVVQFLSYEGTLTAVNGPASGMTSEDIGVSESSTTPAGYSLQLGNIDDGNASADFTWQEAATSTFGEINNNQVFPLGGGTPDPEPEPEPEPEPAITLVFINELHYDNASTDTGEGVEIAGLAGTNLEGWQLVGYNGNGGANYSTTSLSGVIPNQQSGFGTVFFPIPGLQNGSPDGIALVNSEGQVVQFLSYEGAFAAVGGPADGMMSEDIGVAEAGDSPTGYSLQLTGSGSSYDAFTWAASSTATYDEVNNGQTFLPLQDVVFINELHYDNDGADAGEGVEIAGNAGADLSGWQLVLYNGNGGTAYSALELSGTIPNQDNGYGTLFFAITGLQNGAPDGVALINPDGEVVQFLSYEGSFTATDGLAAGVTSEDIGVMESSSTPLNYSLQLTGTGTSYADFTWGGPITSTYNLINTGQSFGGSTQEPEPEVPVEGSIAEARTLPVGTVVTVSGVLTATNQFGGPAYLQDATAGIAVFDPQVHGDGAFAIGDSIQITASVELFNQMPELVNITSIESFGPATTTLAPITTTIADLNQYEGMLVTIPGISFTDPEGLLFPDSNYEITDGTGTVALRIDGDVEDLVGRLKPQEPVTITGIVSSFRGSLQLLPRFMADLPGTEAYVQAGSDIPVAQTLDVMSWNMEFFGATQKDFGPNNELLQLQNAAELLDSIRADIIAVQEVSDENQLQQLVDMLPGYARICSDRYSYSFNGEDPNFPAQKLCFIYNTEVVTVVDERVLFEELYDAARAGQTDLLNNYPSGEASSFWSSGRLPYMVTVDATINGVTERIQLINIHAKSGSNNNDLARRAYDVQVLKDSLDTHYANANLILLGDYNDDVDASIGSGETVYQLFVQDIDYDVVTLSLSEAGLRSYITQENVIDHITISDELYEEYIEGSERLIIPFSYIENYGNTTSDHLPVLVRFELTAPAPLVVDAGTNQTVYFGYAPQACATLTASTPTDGSGMYTYTWSNGQTGQSIQVCPDETTTYTVTVTDSNGRTGTDEVQVCVVNVVCTKNARTPMVEICFRPPGRSMESARTLCVPVQAVEPMLKLGATLGSCGTVACGEEAVEPAPSMPFSITVYPNPLKDFAEVKIEGMVNGDVQVVLYDHFSNEVLSKQISTKDGSFKLDLNSNRLKAGLYYLKVISQNNSQTVRIIKQ
ncbi:hypothetical protein GCM10007389_03860 [Pontibacter akesuensis]|nr:hypothetical protein GCM10007389_03860 [Pontibacter akesuensis]